MGFSYFYEQATAAAILISVFAAVIWYVLAMICLFVLRRKEPQLFRPYRTPAFPWLPAFVALIAAFAGYLFVRVNVQVLVPTALSYAAAGLWYAIWGRHNVLATAPEEVATRIAEKVAQREREAKSTLTEPAHRVAAIERITGGVLFLGVLSLGWMVVRASNLIPYPIRPIEVWSVTGVWIALFSLVSYLGFFSTRRAI